MTSLILMLSQIPFSPESISPFQQSPRLLAIVARWKFPLQAFAKLLRMIAKAFLLILICPSSTQRRPSLASSENLSRAASSSRAARAFISRLFKPGQPPHAVPPICFCPPYETVKRSIKTRPEGTEASVRPRRIPKQRKGEENSSDKSDSK